MPRDGDRDRDRDRAAPLRSVVASPDLASTVAEVGQRWPYAPRRERCRGRGAAGASRLRSAPLCSAGPEAGGRAPQFIGGGEATPTAPSPAPRREPRPPRVALRRSRLRAGRGRRGGGAACGGCELPRREPSCCPLTPQSASRAP